MSPAVAQRVQSCTGYRQVSARGGPWRACPSSSKTLCGAATYRTRPAAQRDARIVAMLRALGAVPVGKSNVPAVKCEYSMAAFSTGERRRRTKGDRRSTEISLAAFCGVCTLRASRGRMTIDGSDAILPPMPRDPLATAEAYVSGVFTRTMADLQYVMTALLPPIPSSPPLSPPHCSPGGRGVPVTPGLSTNYSPPSSSRCHVSASLAPALPRLAVTAALPGVPIDSRIKEALEALSALLEARASAMWQRSRQGVAEASGGKEVQPPGEARETHDVASGDRSRLVLAALADAPELDWPQLDRANKALTAGWDLKGDEELEARACQVAWARGVQSQQAGVLEDFFLASGFAAWVLPVCGVLPFEHNPSHRPFQINGADVPYWRPLRGCVVPVSVTGHPVVTMPLALVDGLPCGMQVVGRLGRDEDLLALCVILEEMIGRLPPPAFFGCDVSASRHVAHPLRSSKL
eukprot:jgi/Mesen1/10667/ME000009S10462